MFAKVAETSTTFDPIERIWRGPKRDIKTGFEASVGRAVLESLFKHPDHISQISDNSGRTYTNEDIANMSIRVAQNLQDMGLRQEEVIGICAANSDFLAPLVIGGILCGTIISSLDPSFDRDGIRHIFSITRPKLMFCDGKIYDTIKEVLADINLEIQIFTMKDHLEGVRPIHDLIASNGKDHCFQISPLKLGSKQTAAIVCSSGTTGLPKGVCVSHESLLNRNIFDLSTDDKLLCFSSIYWASGLLSLLQGTIDGATRVITDEVSTAELFLRIVEEYNVNVVFGTPTLMAMAVQSKDFEARNLTSLELYMCVGMPAPTAVVQRFTEHVKTSRVMVCYGMSELTNGCTLGVPTKPGNNGKLMPNCEMKITNDSGERLGASEEGEVCIKTPFVWAGYYKNKTATRSIYDEDGWIHSGDIGYFDEEGCLFIVGRKKDILKYNNFHFFPAEIEEVVTEIPGVAEACVCGVPDVTFGSLPAAAILKLPNSTLTEEDVSSYVAEKMAHFKRLRGGVYFVNSLPKTPSGKSIRSKVAKIVQKLSEGRGEYLRGIDSHQVST